MASAISAGKAYRGRLRLWRGRRLATSGARGARYERRGIRRRRVGGAASDGGGSAARHPAGERGSGERKIGEEEWTGWYH